jgi:hypothetical protein
MSIVDSGHRTTFETGAVRDAQSGRGRCDLLPLGVIGEMLGDDVLIKTEKYIRTGDKTLLYDVLATFLLNYVKGNWYDMFLDVAKHYEDGAKKYSDRNWEKGIPLHCYIDSGIRHYLKFKRGDDDEPHGRAFVWNILGALWTQENKPEMIDLPFAKIENGYL